MADAEPVSEKELEKRLEQRTAELGSLQAVYVEDSYITWWSGHLRIALGEKIVGKTHWRTAVLMEVGDAERLVANLNNVLTKLRKMEEVEAHEGAEGEEKDT